jgi:hypothetical protein
MLAIKTPFLVFAAGTVVSLERVRVSLGHLQGNLRIHTELL